MKTISTVLLFLFCLSTGFSQNLQFASACDTSTFCTGAVDCDSALVSLSIVASTDDTCGLGNDAVTYTYKLFIDDGGSTTMESGTGNSIDQALFLGDHRFVVYATDACTGELDSCVNTLHVRDCLAPQLDCLSGIVVIPMPAPGNFIDIWAADFAIGTTDNCDEENELTFAFSSDPNELAERFDCEDVTGETMSRTIYAFDQAGNFSTCDVEFLLAPCDSTVSQGTFCFYVETPTGEPVKKIDLINTCLDDTISATGFGCFPKPSLNCQDLRLYKNNDWLNGVTTFDLLLMTRHVLNIVALDSPYKIIAADINNNGVISAFDILSIRRLILNLDTEVQESTSWRFIPSDFTFDPDDVFATPFPEAYSISALLGTFEEVIGVKVGDLNDSAASTGRTGQTPGQDLPLDGRPAHSRDDNSLNLYFSDQFLEKGEIVDVPIRAMNDRQFFGMQWALHHGNGLELLEIVPGLPGMSDDNFSQGEGHLLSSWHLAEGVEASANDPLLTLRFRAQQSGQLSDWLRLENDLLQAEAYTMRKGDFWRNVVQLTAKASHVAANQVKWYPGQPNPFRNMTSFQLDLPKADQIRLSVFDVSGRLVHQQEGNYDKGSHHFSLRAEQLDGSGLYICELQTSEEIQIQKLVLQ
ncbi:MAG: T9SS type A sorting domain-containing protein [Bacteroidota bacterium]